VTALELAEMTAAGVAEYRRAAIALLNAAVEAGSSREAARAERKVVSELALHVFRRVPVFAFSEPGGEQLGVLAAAFAKRPLGEWGRYVNAYVVHTRMPCRGAGYATAAYRAVAEEGIQRGCARLTTTAGTLGGWRVHRALSWPAWGLNEARQIVTDADLTGRGPAGLPMRCAKLRTPGRPLTWAEHAAALADPLGPYRVDPASLPAEYRVGRQ
jgi:hypothetical protein